MIFSIIQTSPAISSSARSPVPLCIEMVSAAPIIAKNTGYIAKVPSNQNEAVMSSLMGLFEKRRAKKFFEFIQSYDFTNPATHQVL